MRCLAMLAAAAVTLAVSGMSAEACNPLLTKKGAVATKLPASMLARNNPSAPARTSIVGLWHDVHTASDGSLFIEGYDTWNSDGTENEVANVPPATGPICVGAWRQSGRSIQLIAHVTWLYDTNNNFVGTLDMTQVNKMKGDNEYTGTFDAKFYDPTGKQFNEVTGTTKADRLN